MRTAPDPDRSRREWMAVGVVTLLGFGLRSWPPGRFGLTHFDEGIYALAAGSIFGPKGLAGIDPVLIPYAPPGYPILAGLASAILGRSDFAMIAASQMAGTLTIPVVAWLARRTFGPGAGFASATFAASSGPDVAFSRMALTDASFLLAWLIALGAGMRFLERPGAARGVALGLAVGLAQQFKYNGWLAGAIVILSAALAPLVRPGDRRAVLLFKTFGWGGLAAAVAWVVVRPWYRFVEGHGGYSDLLRHQRGYLGGPRDWWPHFRIQAEQAIALSGGPWLVGGCLAVAGLTLVVVRPDSWRSATVGLGPARRLMAAVGSFVLPLIFVDAPFWLGLLMAPWLLTSPKAAVRLVGVGWLVLAAMTPFYHPYARLLLPLHAANWLLMGWLVADGFAAFSDRANWGPSKGRPGVAYVAVVLAMGSAFVVATRREAGPLPGLFDPSDSLRRTCSRIASILPEGVVELRLLARPPVIYYLFGRVAVQPQLGSDQLLEAGDPRAWALVDSAILRSEQGTPSGGSPRDLPPRLADHWEVVEEFPTELALPTLLDLDPGAARRGAKADRSAPLWLLRPRRPGAHR